jgi:hypothetical protein
VRRAGAWALLIPFLAVTSACSAAHRVTPSATITMEDGASRADVEAVRANLDDDGHAKAIHFKHVRLDGLPGSSVGVFEITLRGEVDGSREGAALQRLPGVVSVSVKLPRHA